LRTITALKYRHRVLALLASMSMLTYLDRVCISVAGPRLQNDLQLSPHQWGLATSAFAIAYALFEIPSGHLADRFGARAMLTRIVLWWSTFTTLTGFVTNLWSLMVVRFFFGAGEAGAYPTAATSVYRWFPANERGRAYGVVLLSGQLGAALAPLIIVPVQMHLGWRVSFYLFGVVGMLWSGVWWSVYRNRPVEKPGISAAEVAEIGTDGHLSHSPLPWGSLLSNASVWGLMGSAGAYLFSYSFFLFWLPTYMVRERGFSESETKLLALPFLLGAASNLVGGIARDAAVRRFGLRWGSRLICQSALFTAAVSAVAALYSPNKYVAFGLLVLCYGGITFQQTTVFATCIDIGRRYTGAVAGCMNSGAALGGLVSSLIFGYLVEYWGNYDGVLISMAVALALGGALWFLIDASKPLQVPATPSRPD
jgi:MFS transporter, ACS family, glucarate transporter